MTIESDPHSTWWHVRVADRIVTHCRSRAEAEREKQRLEAEQRIYDRGYEAGFKEGCRGTVNGEYNVHGGRGWARDDGYH